MSKFYLYWVKILISCFSILLRIENFFFLSISYLYLKSDRSATNVSYSQMNIYYSLCVSCCISMDVSMCVRLCVKLCVSQCANLCVSQYANLLAVCVSVSVSVSVTAVLWPALVRGSEKIWNKYKSLVLLTWLLVLRNNEILLEK